MIPAPFHALAEYDQWILWRAVPLPTGKTAKYPTDPLTRHTVTAQDPNGWMDAATAYRLAAETGLGVGFVFTAQDPFFFLDLDGCLVDGQWSAQALEACRLFPHAAVETSHSGKGLHIFGKYQGDVPHCCEPPGGIGGLYTEGRFCALTGDHLRGDSGVDCTAAYVPYVARTFSPTAFSDAGLWADEPCEEWTGMHHGLLCDDELIRRALKSTSEWRDKASFKELWEVDADRLAELFPPDHMDATDPFNGSAVDAALARHLAFWTGNHHERIYNIMMRDDCALKRDKWADRPDYLRERTIPRIVGTCDRVFSRPPIVLEGAPDPEMPDGPLRRHDYQLMPPDQQIQHFAGCTYVRSLNRVITDRGDVLDQPRFKVTYGGYHFSLDDKSDATTKDAWEAYTQSQTIDYPQADGVCFLPGKPHDTLHAIEGDVLANTWRVVPIDRRPGDVSRFLSHVRKILPNGDDAEIVLNYMAAVVQHQGQKFLWCPVVQGVPGNGKSLLARVLRTAIGARYVSEVRASQLVREKYNQWLAESVLVVVNDMFIPPGESAAMDKLKPMITEPYGEIRRMGAAGVTERICANFFMTANRDDAIPKTTDDRRFAVFFCPQQRESDLQRDGLTDQYFRALHEWLGDGGGMAHVAEYLHTRPILDRWNPATHCVRAPATSSQDEAIKAGRSLAEQAIAEARDNGTAGLQGGWLSSAAVTHVLQAARLPSAPRSVGHAVASLGYVHHPALPDGRVQRIVLPDGVKPRLYVQVGSVLELNSVTPDQAMSMYEKAQGVTPMTTQELKTQ